MVYLNQDQCMTHYLVYSQQINGNGHRKELHNCITPHIQPIIVLEPRLKHLLRRCDLYMQEIILSNKSTVNGVTKYYTVLLQDDGSLIQSEDDISTMPSLATVITAKQCFVPHQPH